MNTNTPKTLIEIESTVAARLMQVCRRLALEGQFEHVVNVILTQEMALLDDQPELVRHLVEGVVYETPAAARVGAIVALDAITSGGRHIDQNENYRSVLVDWTGGQITVDALDVGWNREPSL